MIIDVQEFYIYLTAIKGLSKGSLQVCKIKAQVINRFFSSCTFDRLNLERFFFELKEKGSTNNTLNTYIFAFRYINDFFKSRNIHYEFLNDLKSFKKNKTPISLPTKEEIELLLNTNNNYGNFHGKSSQTLNHTYLTLTRFIFYTGCRYFEGANLTVEALDLFAQKARILGKNGSYRWVYFTQPLTDMLRLCVEGKNSNDLVFTNVLGKPIHYSDFRIDMQLRAKNAGITKKIRPHLIRHYFGTAHYEETRDIAMTATLLGHADIQTTYQTYVHMADSTIRESAYRHPAMRQNLPPNQILKFIKENILKYNLDSDNRFKYSITETEKGLFFSIEVL